jgi:hypothetical protein
VLHDLSQLTPIEWVVITLATAVTLLGSLLPKIGNQIGRVFLGEDPMLARWTQARLERRRKHEVKVAARRERRTRIAAGPQS